MQLTASSDVKTEDPLTDNYANGQDGEARVTGENGQTSEAQNGNYAYEPSGSQGIGIKEDG